MQSLPVLMHHYISSQANSIAVSPECFVNHCQAMKDNGWRGISLEEAEDYLLRAKPLPKGAALITFDDGYLDNGVHAAPVLREFGHCGTVFAVAGRLEDSGAMRLSEPAPAAMDEPMTRDAAGHPVRRDVFLSWTEAKALHEGGVLQVAGHSLHHDSVFLGPEYEGFHRPAPQLRTFHGVHADRPWGMPLFPVGPALVHRAFLPSDELLALVRATVPQDAAGADAFFAADGNSRLSRALDDLPGDRWGRREEPDEFEARVREDLAESRALMEKHLGRAPISLAWPWGASCPESLEIARDVGFRVFFDVTMGANRPGRPNHVHRFKVKSRPPAWLLQRLRIYSRPLTASLYALTRDFWKLKRGLRTKTVRRY